MSAYSIYPQPHNIFYSKRTLELCLIQKISFGKGIPKKTVLPYLEVLDAALKFRLGYNFSDSLQKCKGSIRVEYSGKLKSQHYQIKVKSKSISIKASCERAIKYALHTLVQIIEQSDRSIRCVSIEDGPDFENRGIMLDISRCKVPSMETLKRTIRWMEKMRFTQLQLYIEHTYAYKNHKKVWAESSPLTAPQIRELDRYCLQHDIELVANMNSFGHFERWLKHEEYKHLAECEDGFEHPINHVQFTHGTTLNPNQKSLDFIKSLFDEYFPNFSTSIVNIGGDETWELGLGKSKKQAQKIGKEHVYLKFLKKIYKELDKRGRSMMFWGDIIIKNPELISELPENIIAMNWGYEASSPYSEQCPHFKKSGIPFYVCPGTSSWLSISGRLGNAKENLKNAALNGVKNGAIGYLVTDWGDGGHHQMISISYTPFVLASLYSWNHKSSINDKVPSILAKEILNTSNTDLAKALEKLGHLVDKGVWHPINSSLIHNLLTSQGYNRASMEKTFPKLNSQAISKFYQEVLDIRNSVENIIHQNEECLMVKDEILHTLNILQFTFLKFMDLTKRGHPDLTKMDLLTFDILEKHSKLWLQRNRVGGLSESNQILKSNIDYK